MKIRHLERRIIVGSRFLAAIAVAGSLAGSLLMFLVGGASVIEAYGVFWPGNVRGPDVRPATAATIGIIEALDRFLIAIVLLYFSYGVYSLFIHPERAEEELSLPAWLRIERIGQLKQVVAEVILVILFVLFLRTALETFQHAPKELNAAEIATLAVLPVSAALLALALWLVQLHPKPSRGDDGAAPSGKAPPDAGP